MPRARNIPASREKRNRWLKKASGFYGGRSRLIRTARDTVWRAGAYSFAHRRKRPGDFRKLWIIRINAACRINGTTYSRFINALNKLNIGLDRKVLADLAVTEPNTFKTLVERCSAVQ